MKINPEIFRGYDIRGRYPKEINEELAERLGQALPHFFKGKKAVVGYDMRPSSKALEQALVAGLIKAGANVIRIGLMPTPLVSYALILLKADFGVIVSASHSSGQYNAFKIIDRKANQIGAEQGLGKIQELLEKKFSPGKRGTDERIAILPRYRDELVKKFRKRMRPLNIVADYGNGMGAISARAVFKKLKVKVRELFPKPDGRFPNHEPNPHDPKNFKALIHTLKSGRYDLGIFFDGDADRAVFFDHNGIIVPPDIAAGIFALDILKRHPGAEIYHDLRFSKAVLEEIKKSGGKPMELGVGNPIYKEKIHARKNAWLGAEISGHTMFREWRGIDDGLFAALAMVEIISRAKKPLAVLALPFRRYYQSGEWSVKIQHPRAALAKLARRFRGGKRSRLDGLSVEYPDWWFTARSSRTEPFLRISVEAKSESTLRHSVAEIQRLVSGKA